MRHFFYREIVMIEDTIAAVATPPGDGGIGIIRISGDKSLEILKSVFRSAKGTDPESRPRELVYGHVFDAEKNMDIDEVLAVFFPAPHTYTAEDVVEINCHGGFVPLQKTLDLIIRSGARPAEPGEFTKRAFLNGRIDLAQAEAVIDVIDAKTESAGEAAMLQLRGRFSDEISAIRNKIIDILVDIDVNIDYPDEDIEELQFSKLIDNLTDVGNMISELSASSRAGRIIKDGLNVAIVGKPNVGKSSLMNRLLRESRAIVTSIPGTTRDTIEEFINIRGIPVKLTDTAGIRETDDIIEKIGIDKSKQSLESADLTVMMLDMSEGITKDDIEIRSSLEVSKTLILFNKSDRSVSVSENDMKEFAGGAVYLVTSMNDTKSVAAIEDAIYKTFTDTLTPSEGSKRAAKSTVVTNARHKAMLERAGKAIEDALSAANIHTEPEIIEIDVREAYEELGFIIGDSVQDDVINEVFSRFCLGK